MFKVIVFTGDLIYSARRNIVEMLEYVDGLEVMILEIKPRRTAKKLLQNQWKNLKRNGVRWVPYQSKDIMRQLKSRLTTNALVIDNAPGESFTRESLLAISSVTYMKSEDPYSDSTIEAVNAFSPDLGVSLAAPILKEALFSIPSKGTINLHKGKLPDYRGMPPAFWELVNGEVSVGCTIHRVEKGLDTGATLLESKVDCKKFSTLRGLQIELDEVGIDLMSKAVSMVKDGKAVFTPQKPRGKTYRKPTLKQFDQLDNKYKLKLADSRVKYLGKSIYFWVYANVIRSIPRIALGLMNRQRIIVLLYHRVNDDMRDSLTVGVQQFEEQMQYLKKNYTVVGIEDIITENIPRNSFKPIIAVTFDDGYQDNYSYATPILLRHRVPAAFFVSTGLIGSADGFPHDLKKIGRALPNMTWEQLKRMKKWGFTIGSHTVSHLNCGKSPLEDVEKELVDSKNSLREALSTNDIIFAYPFGGRNDMNSEALEIVKKTGYQACLSAYGGIISNEIDKYNIKRTGISFNFSKLAFQAKLEGL